MNDPQENQWLCNALRGTDFFAACSMREIEGLITAMDKKSFKQGEKIMKQGEMGEFFFLLGEGKVSVEARSKGEGTTWENIWQIIWENKW